METTEQTAPFTRAKKQKPQATSVLTPQHHDADDDAATLPTYVRYRDLEKAGVVSNRMQLARMIADEQFPVGFKISSNIHVWDISLVRRWLRAKQQQDQAK